MAASGALETLFRPRVHAIAASSSSARSSTSLRGGHVGSISLRLPQFTGIRVSQRIRTIRPATAGQANLRVDRRSTVVCEFRQVSTDVSDHAVQDVTKETWWPSVTQCSKPVVVEFWASWCGPCRMMRPVVARLAGKYNGKLKFFRINMDQSRDIAFEYGVSKIPALLLIKNGEKKDPVIGCPSEKELVSRIDKFLGM